MIVHRIVISTILWAFLYVNLFATNIEVSGTISTNTVWSVDTVKVTGELTINNGITLSINPGVFVEFQGHYKMNVQGRVLAIGTPSDLILFTINDTTGFSNPPRPTTAANSSNVIEC